VPAPQFGITQQTPPAPSPWTAEVAGFYYVDDTAPSASDSRTYGHPSAPRATIPLSLPAGSVVEVHGTYSHSHASPRGILANGTEAAPVFIRGASADAAPVLTRPILIRGSYFILENLAWRLEDEMSALRIVSPTDHAALRHSDVRGNLGGGSIMVASSASLGGVVSDVVVWKNEIHDVGDVQADRDQDRHGIAVGSRTSNVWVVDNVVRDSSGAGVAVNAGNKESQPTLHHVYISRNHIYRTRQAGVGIKQATDVIVSQNLVHDVIHTSWSPSKGLGFQYAPERVWFLYNEVYNCSNGIYAGSDSGMGTGKDSYIIGNVIHGIHHAASNKPNSAWSNAAIMLAGGVNRWVVGNTIYDVDGGIFSPGGVGHMRIVDNIVSGSPGAHVFLEHGSLSRSSSMQNNLLDEPVRIRWGGTRVLDLRGFEQTRGTECSGCLAADPLFVDPVSANFDLSAGSPAIDRGVLEEVYAVFETLYGIDIRIDKAGRPRPQGAGWDIGAYEAAAR
jgi:hypothetical protein